MNELIHVFAGPSLPPSAAPARDFVVYHPPASQGDVYALVASRPLAIAIVDGYFERVPAVWHKEILYAMSRGVHVFGASSMGALRAAELADFGMVGVGSVFEDFARGRLQDDDEVTIVHADETQDFRPGSEAMVNLRATLARAFECGVLSSDAARQLTGYAKSQFYPDRGYPALLAWAKSHLSPPEEESFRGWLVNKANRVDVKRRDALALLNVLQDFAATNPAAKAVPWHFHHTDAWEQVRRNVSVITSPGLPTIVGSEARVLAELAARPELHARLQQEATLRALRVRAAKQDGYVPTESDMQAALADLCREHRLTDATALDAWLRRQDATQADLERLLGDEACARRSSKMPVSVAKLDVLDLLRINGTYAELRSAESARAGLPKGGNE